MTRPPLAETLARLSTLLPERVALKRFGANQPSWCVFSCHFGWEELIQQGYEDVVSRHYMLEMAMREAAESRHWSWAVSSRRGAVNADAQYAANLGLGDGTILIEHAATPGEALALAMIYMLEVKA